MTQALYDSILPDLTESLSFSEIADITVLRRASSSPFLKPFPSAFQKAPESIYIDEFKGNSGIWSSKAHKWRLSKYHCSISDGDSHTVIDILDQITGSAVNPYFRQFPPEERQRVKFFCCDMSNGFISVARKNFGSPLFSGFSPSFSGVFSDFTSFPGRAPHFLGVVSKLLLLPVFTSFF